MHFPHCPNCKSSMQPTRGTCHTCKIEVTGDFTSNEFATLDSEMLQFLRVFIHCEGRIKDMENALGVSYPTIKNKLSTLKETVSQTKQQSLTEHPPKSKSDTSVNDILKKVESGTIEIGEALKLIKNLK